MTHLTPKKNLLNSKRKPLGFPLVTNLTEIPTEFIQCEAVKHYGQLHTSGHQLDKWGITVKLPSNFTRAESSLKAFHFLS